MIKKLKLMQSKNFKCLLKLDSDMRSVISLTVSSIELVPFTYWQGEIEASHAGVLMASS